jgi:zinc transport system substrate-binding protein
LKKYVFKTEKGDVKMSKRLFICIFVSLIIVCSANAADKISVFVSIVPQKYFVQQIGKDMVDAKVMVKPGASPATYEPKPRQMAELSKAKLYFSIGVPFEKAWLKKIAATNPDMRVVHTDHGIEKIAMAAHHHHHDEDDHHGETHEAGHHEADHHKKGHHDEKGHDHKHHHDRDHHDANRHKDEGHHDHAGLDPHIWISPALVKARQKPF